VKRTIHEMIAIAAASTCLSAVAQPAGPKYEFEIDRQPLKAALNAFSKQTGLGVMFLSPKKDEADVLVGPLKGRYTAESALDVIVAGTGLTFTRVNESSIALLEKPKDTTAGTQRLQLMRADVPANMVASQAGRDSAARPAMPRRQSPEDVEVVIVTAQKREQSIQEVPISISVLGGQEMDQGLFIGVNDAIRDVPGVSSYATQQGGTTKFSIRGVTSNGSLFNGSSTVGYYLDEIPFAFARFPVSPDANAYDLERVEVLRGPQGTLYGANALNGVIRILTKDANLNEFEAKGRAMVSSTEHGGTNYRGDLAFNAPIVSDKLAVRAVLGYGDYSGWIDKPAAGRKDVNDAELKNVRVKLNARPTEEFNVELLTWFSRDDRGSPSTSLDNRTVPMAAPEPIETAFDAYGLTMTYDFPSVSVLSATSNMKFSNLGIMDQFTALLSTELGARLTSEEIRLSSRGEGPWRWSVGGIYRDAEDFSKSIFALSGPGVSHTVYKSESVALFGEVSRSLFNDQWELTAGLRYFEDKSSNFERSTFLPTDTPLGQEQTFDATTPRVVLAWRPMDEMSLYASYSEGFRSGFGQNGQILRIVPAAVSVNPDRLYNYEVGAKGNVFDGRVTYDLAVYYMDWQDTVQRLFINLGTPTAPIYFAQAINAESADGLGVDFGATVEIIDGLEFSATMSWNDLTFSDDVFSRGVLVYAKGDRLDESPELTAGGRLSYAFDIARDYTGTFAGGVDYHSKMVSRNISTGAEDFGDDILTARVSFTLGGASGWNAMIFCDNLTDEAGIVRPFPGIAYYSDRLRPRTIGLQFDQRF